MQSLVIPPLFAVIDGSMSIGAMTTFLLYVIFVAGSLGILSSVYGVCAP